VRAGGCSTTLPENRLYLRWPRLGVIALTRRGAGGIEGLGPEAEALGAAQGARPAPGYALEYADTFLAGGT